MPQLAGKAGSSPRERRPSADDSVSAKSSRSGPGASAWCRHDRAAGLRAEPAGSTSVHTIVAGRSPHVGSAQSTQTLVVLTAETAQTLTAIARWGVSADSRSLAAATALAACVLALGLPASARAAPETYYVAPGSVTSPPCPQATPCNIVSALTVAVSGDTVVMEGDKGTYATAGSPSLASIDVPEGVTLTGDTAQAMPVLYSAEVAPDDAGVKLMGPNSKLSYLDIEYSGPGFALSGSGTVDRVIAHGIASAGCFFGFEDTTVTNSLCTGTYGIFEIVGGGGAWTVTMRNTTIYSAGNALDLGTSGPHLTINATNTLIHSTGGSDIESNQSGSGALTVALDHSSYASVSNTGATVTPAGSGTNQTLAPALLDPAHADFMEALSSPTVGAGVNDPANGTLDLAGAPREIAGRTDIGAYELVEAPAVTELPPSSITTTGAAINGTVNPNGVPTSFHVDFGTTAAYGSSTAAQQLAAGTLPQPVLIGLGGLTPSTGYHYRIVASNSGGTTYGSDQLLRTTALPSGSAVSASASGSPSPSGQAVAPVISALAESASRWREGRALARFSRRTHTALGTTFRITLSQPATLQLGFMRSVAGRRAGGTCVPQTRRNAHRRSCRLARTAGTLSWTAHAGVNTVRFLGAVSAHRELPLGRYTLVAEAVSAAGLKSQPRTIGFTIVKR